MSPDSRLSPVTRDLMAERILAEARRNPRIVGLVDIGSSNRGQGDDLSDLDLGVFVRDEDKEVFEAGWKAWAGQFGPLLLAYIGGVGHPWVVYDATPVPLRVDFAFRRKSEVEEVLTWTTAPSSVEAMIWYDETGGALVRCVEQIVGQSLAPADLRATFDQVCGDLWYYLLRTDARIQRRELWAARHDYSFAITGNLLALLRLEAGAVERWRGTLAASRIEAVLTEDRLAQLEGTVPGRSETELRRGMLEAARLGYEVSARVARDHDWDWPERLARQVIVLLETDSRPAPTDEDT